MSRQFLSRSFTRRTALQALSVPVFALGLWTNGVAASAGETKNGVKPLPVNVGVFTGSDTALAQVVFETLLTDLAKSSRLAVMDDRLRVTNTNGEKTGNEGAYVLTGTCLIYENKIIVNTRLVDNATGRTVPGAAENMDGPRDQVFSLVHNLADRLKNRLESLVTMSSRPSAEQPAPGETSRVEIAAMPNERIEADYTGIIIDTRGHNIERSMSPCLRRKDGTKVWTGDNATADFVIETGIVGYAHTEEAARANSRAGSKPLVLKAVGRFADNFRCDPLLLDEDAEFLLRCAKRTGFLTKFNVVFLTD
jgi:TolB-like protein